MGRPRLAKIKFLLSGFGVNANDRVSWASAVNDADCNNVNLTTGMQIRQMTVLWRSSHCIKHRRVNFTKPSAIYFPHRLCYGFGIEPKCTPSSVCNRCQTCTRNDCKYAIINVNTSITFFGAREGQCWEVNPLVKDRAKWVVGKLREGMDGTPSNSQLQMYDNMDCADDPAPGTKIETVTRDPVLPLGKAVFLFTVPYDVGDGSLQAADAAYAGTRLRVLRIWVRIVSSVPWSDCTPLRPRISNVCPVLRCRT